MIKIGVEPYYECSSKGDKRFSAFYANLKQRNNNTIEEIYQAAKVFEDGSFNLSWREAKGRVAINQDDVALLYSKLWNEYIAENPELIDIIKRCSGFSDIFGQDGHCCQALELWRIRNQLILDSCDTKIIVAGSRSFNDYALFCDHLEKRLLTDDNISLEDTCFITGLAAHGPDAMIVRWCLEHQHLNWVGMPANWNRDGRAAGYIRNTLMARAGTHLIAYWDSVSKGTKHMINISIDHGLDTQVIMVDSDDYERN